MVQHTVSDAILLSYAAGTLPRAFELVVATHVSLSDDARARLGGYEALGGAIINDMDCVDMADGALDDTLARIAEMAPAPRPATRKTGLFPTPLQQAIGGDETAVKWRPVGMGVRQSVICADDGGSARLLAIPGGQAMPKHTHRGTELTLVLQGAFTDDDARFARGDLEIADDHDDHAPIAETGQDCICLIATEAPVRFQGMIPRMVQPFIGI